MRNILRVVAISALSTAIAITAFADESRLVNISTRGLTGTGDTVIIGGFVLESSAKVLIRGIGPSLAAFGVPAPISAPSLELFDKDGRLIAANEDWRQALLTGSPPGAENTPPPDFPEEALLELMASSGAFLPTAEPESALYLELPPGAYTAQVSNNAGTTGFALVEVYSIPPEIDPFAPGLRLQAAADPAYAPTRRGLAPVAAIDETHSMRLLLTFDGTPDWPLGAETGSPGPTLSLPFLSGGANESRHGRPGRSDSRGFATSTRYTKTGPDTALVETRVTTSAAGDGFAEQFVLTFSHLGGGRFTATWSEISGPDGSPGPVRSSASGTFAWEPLEASAAPDAPLPFFRTFSREYLDNRPSTAWGLRIQDHGIVLAHGDGPGGCDANGAREAVVTAVGDAFVLHYDGCADTGWLACRAVSTDLVHWEKHGPVLPAGPAGSIDAGCVCSPWTIWHEGLWHMFYLATPGKTPPPHSVPTAPYYTRKATAPSMFGPWTKAPDVIPFDPRPDTYYSHTASPGPVIREGSVFLQYFSAATVDPDTGRFVRTLGLAETTDLDGPWTIHPEPLLPLEEQIENASLYFENANGLWFLFTNHVGIDAEGIEYTDAVWVYWSDDPRRFTPEDKAVVIDATTSSWARSAIGMPSVVAVGDRLALLYDGNQAAAHSHLQRDIGLAWIELPLQPPNRR